ncbi:MAG: prepilin-type N-terminal cleavage/methylation domain-containing protein [Akkermansia sp.]|nr:prepilin-type N-terminal cleavage/methylation domain-containing protein [Akkermansia sp.]
MKLNRQTGKGFTLVEILVAVAILAMLASGMWVAVGSYQNKKLVKKAETEIQLLEASMNEYRTDNGGMLPFGRGDEESSNIMYCALSCDYNNDGEPDDENGVTRMPYCPTFNIIRNPKAAEQGEGIPVLRVSIRTKEKGRRKVLVVLDPWGKPYRYRLGCEAEDEKGKVGEGINADFDIFSQVADGQGDSTNKNPENDDNISNIKLL